MSRTATYCRSCPPKVSESGGGDGRNLLDCDNNTPHIRHCNRRVVDAISLQASTLNTRTRYLRDGILDYRDNGPNRAAMFERLGQDMARLHNVSDACRRPGGFTCRTWNCAELLGDTLV